MITYLLINDATNKMIYSSESSVTGFRHFGKYYDGKQVSCFTGLVLSTVSDDIEMLSKCGLSF